jgi:hypothetical protein
MELSSYFLVFRLLSKRRDSFLRLLLTWNDCPDIQKTGETPAFKVGHFSFFFIVFCPILYSPTHDDQTAFGNRNGKCNARNGLRIG